MGSPRGIPSKHDVPFQAQVAGVDGLSPDEDAARFEFVLNEAFHG